jgi:hypothetical protein
MTRDDRRLLENLLTWGIWGCGWGKRGLEERDIFGVRRLLILMFAFAFAFTGAAIRHSCGYPTFRKWHSWSVLLARRITFVR